VPATARAFDPTPPATTDDVGADARSWIVESLIEV
jgi:hypothetical protein